MTELKVSDEAVEVGAQALTSITGTAWESCLPGTRQVLRRNARVPLEAAAALVVAAELERLVEETDWAWAVGDSLKRRAAELRGLGQRAGTR